MSDDECGVLWCKNTATVAKTALKGNIIIWLCQEHREYLYPKAKIE